MDFLFSKMERRIIALSCFIFAILAGCKTPPVQSYVKESQTLKLNNFEIQIPTYLTHKYVRENQSIAYTSFEAPTSEYIPSDFAIEIYPKESNLPNSECIKTGSSNMIEKADSVSKTRWGRVDFFEKYGWDYEPGQEPLCRPFGGETGAGYVLCSEKDDKIVLVCISQVTDNPQLAEQILSTFKWTE